MSNQNKEKVGFKKPPKQNQFKKGVSGNPNGRPKGSKNTSLSNLLEKEFASKIQLKEGGSLTKKEAFVKKTVNNLLQADDVRKVRPVLELLAKLEGKNSEQLLATDFLQRLIREDYINPQDAEDFARNRKDPNFNIPKAIHELHNGSVIHSACALEGVKYVRFLSCVYSMFGGVQLFNMFDRFLNEEVHFWEVIDALLLLLNLDKADEKKLRSLFQKTRSYPRPDSELLKYVSTILNIKTNNLYFLLLKERDSLKDLSFYLEHEKTIFDKSRVKDELKDVFDDYSEDELLDGVDEVLDNYNYFMSIPHELEFTDPLDQVLPEDSQKFFDWFKSVKKPQKKLQDVMDLISKEYLN